MMPRTEARAPRQYLGTPAGAAPLPEPGMPQDRHARIAARRAFVGLKQQFMAATELLDGMRGDWLRWQVRQTREPVDLWLLRGAVFSALESQHAHADRTRAELTRVLDSVFPDGGELLPWGMRA